MIESKFIYTLSFYFVVFFVYCLLIILWFSLLQAFIEHSSDLVYIWINGKLLLSIETDTNLFSTVLKWSLWHFRDMWRELMLLLFLMDASRQQPTQQIQSMVMWQRFHTKESLSIQLHQSPTSQSVMFNIVVLCLSIVVRQIKLNSESWFLQYFQIFLFKMT